jgi:hypothetical protein
VALLAPGLDEFGEDALAVLGDAVVKAAKAPKYSLGSSRL